jgi:hypothetical protein
MSAVRFSQLAPGARLCTWGLAFGLLSLFLVAPATAQLAVSSKPVYPQVVQVGDTDVPVEIVIRNDSSGQVGTIEISEIFHSPSCQNVSFPCSAPDVAVFDVSATATGGAACTGITFTVVPAEPPLDQVQFVPDAMILLAPMEECAIAFTVDVLAAPGSDADPMSPGVQTFQTSSARGDDTDSALAGIGTGSDLTTVVEAAIEVTKECEDGFGADGMITFSGTVTNTGGVELTGVTVVDDSGTPGDTADDQTVFGPATLAPGESQPFSGSYTPPASPSTDVVTASGDFTVGDVTDTVTDTAEATCELIDCAVEVDKQISCDGGLTFVDVLESDDPDGTAVESCVGWSAFDGNEAEPVTVRYVARNAGSVALSCTLTDTNDLVLAEAQNFELAVDETFELVDDDQVCSADLAALEPNTAQVQCVCAGFENEEPVQAQDTASFECQEPGLAVTKLCEAQVDDVNAVTIDVTNPDNADDRGQAAMSSSTTWGSSTRRSCARTRSSAPSHRARPIRRPARRPAATASSTPKPRCLEHDALRLRPCRRPPGRAAGAGRFAVGPAFGNRVRSRQASGASPSHRVPALVSSASRSGAGISAASPVAHRSDTAPERDEGSEEGVTGGPEEDGGSEEDVPGAPAADVETVDRFRAPRKPMSGPSSSFQAPRRTMWEPKKPFQALLRTMRGAMRPLPGLRRPPRRPWTPPGRLPPGSCAATAACGGPSCTRSSRNPCPASRYIPPRIRAASCWACSSWRSRRFLLSRKRLAPAASRSSSARVSRSAVSTCSRESAKTRVSTITAVRGCAGGAVLRSRSTTRADSSTSSSAWRGVLPRPK